MYFVKLLMYVNNIVLIFFLFYLIFLPLVLNINICLGFFFFHSLSQIPSLCNSIGHQGDMEIWPIFISYNELSLGCSVCPITCNTRYKKK